MPGRVLFVIQKTFVKNIFISKLILFNCEFYTFLCKSLHLFVAINLFIRNNATILTPYL